MLPPTGTLKVCCGIVNRGFAVYGDRLFMTTLDAHLVALDAKTGKVVWDVEMADYKAGYAATVAPLVVKDKVIVGIAGGEFAIRGFLDAYDAADRQARVALLDDSRRRASRAARPGRPRSLGARRRAHLGDRQLRSRAEPDLLGHRQSQSRSLRRRAARATTCTADRVIALDADTGKLKWHFQFTPHDAHDWDANQVPGARRPHASAGSRARSLMAANRNGFFYVLDRTNGEFLCAKPYIKQTWAKEIGTDGRPVEIAGSAADAEGGTLDLPGSLRRHQLHVAVLRSGRAACSS